MVGGHTAWPACFIANVTYCERGASGPDGAGGLCCSSDFFNESRTPPPLDGTAGAPPAGCDCEVGAMIELGFRS